MSAEMEKEDPTIASARKGVLEPMSAEMKKEDLTIASAGKGVLEAMSAEMEKEDLTTASAGKGVPEAMSAGKTTLLQLCATLIHPTSGTVTILGMQLGKFDIFELRTRIGITSSAFVKEFPEDEIVMDVVLTAAYAVLGRWQEKYDLWDESRAKALLTALGVRALS